MLIVEILTLPNGAHRNQSGSFTTILDGWAQVPEELEAEATSYLPFIELTVEGGQITAVAQGTVPEVEEEAPVMTTEEAMLDMLVDINYRMSLIELGIGEGST